MLFALIGFELRRRLKMLSSWIYVVILGGASMFLMLAASGAFKSISTATGSERIHANAPVSITSNMASMGLIALFTVAAVFGQAATQDFLHGTWSIIFTRRIKKSTYLLGRFAGAYVFSALVFASIPLGLLIGALTAQIVDPSQLGPHRLEAYLWPYLSVLLPMLFLSGAVFFTLAALSRHMAPVYVGVVVLVLGYTVLSTALADVQHKELAALFDPFGLLSIDLVTRYWTPAERNTQFVHLVGPMLVNRVLWGAVALGLLGATIAFFRMTVSEQRGKGSTRDEDETPRGPYATVRPQPTTSGWLSTAVRSGWLSFREVIQSPVYWSFVVAGTSFALIGMYFSSRSTFGTPTLPVTYQALDLAEGTMRLFCLITITFYSGELVWKERDAGLADIVFATRAPAWVTFVGQVLALVLLAASLELAAGVAAFSFQVSQGYFAIEPKLYFTELVIFGAAQLVPLCVLALTVQVLVNHKYLGHAAMIGWFLTSAVMRALGVEERLIQFGSEPGISYSDMNGYGHFVAASLTWRALWYAACVVLLCIAGVLTVRTREPSNRQRLKAVRPRVNRAWLVTLSVALVATTAMGARLFYSTHIAHPYITAKDEERLTAEYEKNWRSWRNKAQPRITAADVNFDLYPNEAAPRLAVKGTYTLVNKSSEDISDVLLSLPRDATVNSMTISGVAPATHEKALGLFVVHFERPMAPGDTRPLSFDLEFRSVILTHASPRVEVVGNGTFFDNFNLPSIGYDDRNELSEDGVRKTYELPPKERMAARDDALAHQHNYIRQDADYITLRSTVSTVSDQIAVVPGSLEKQWSADGRRYFTYVMQTPILGFFSVLSARYEVLRDEWQGVKLEIYFHPTHRENLERMMLGMKDALAYCADAFGPYQHTQARILEFPRYKAFAQSFPNTIPYSESVGFIAKVRPDDPDDIDYPYYITAHEIAHQWWAHQVVGANVRGATMTSESMAQYSALMVMKKKYGEKRMRRYLKYELDRYLMGRVFERKKELPLAHNENQQYVHYQKGSLAMYALQHFIGEDRVNAGLKKYVASVKFKGPPYTDAGELVNALREQTPAEYAYLIDDLFETITLYDNRAVSASMKQNASGAWDITLKVKAVKYRAADDGAQTELDFNDAIDVGALDAKGEVLFLEPRRIAKGDSTLTFTVAQKPATVGIDPINVLVDRTSDDNLTVPTTED